MVSVQKVIDLHCDLLYYLAGDEKRNASDLQLPCAIPYLEKGGVALQVLAVFTQTGPNSVQSAHHQMQLMKNLPQNATSFSYAFENASGFCNEEENLQAGFERLARLERPVYISLTWNEENRFGGGNLTHVGLKDDGKRLLDFLHDKHIAVDLSHTSDQLAQDIFYHVDLHKLHIPLIASHSNFRAVCNQPRNLPDEFVEEIIKREGIIGLNFVRPFVSENERPKFKDHIAHALTLGCASNLCFGADFFYSVDIENTYGVPHFFEEYGTSAVYPKMLNLMKQEWGMTLREVENMASKNFLRFAEKFLHRPLIF